MKLIATLPLYRKYRTDVIDHPFVDELRFNTATPLDDSVSAVVTGLKRVCTKPLWIDLKTRQLRITEFSYLPFSHVTVSHDISVDTPCDVFFKTGKSTIESVRGSKLIITRPPVTVGKGEPLNITDPGLLIHGYFTDTDKEYIDACMMEGMDRYMLSFYHGDDDCDLLLEKSPGADVIAKIEDLKGLEYVSVNYGSSKKKPRLMAACDDLYVNAGRDKTAAVEALYDIIRADPNAVAASKILCSVYDEKNDSPGSPSFTDIAYLYLLRDMGYKTVMLGDDVTAYRDVFAEAMNVYSQFLKRTGEHR